MKIKRKRSYELKRKMVAMIHKNDNQIGRHMLMMDDDKIHLIGSEIAKCQMPNAIHNTIRILVQTTSRNFD